MKIISHYYHAQQPCYLVCPWPFWLKGWLHRCCKEAFPWLSGLVTVPPIAVRQDGEVRECAVGSILETGGRESGSRSCAGVGGGVLARRMRRRTDGTGWRHAGGRRRNGRRTGTAEVHEGALIRRLLRVAAVSTSQRPPAGSGAGAGGGAGPRQPGWKRAGGSPAAPIDPGRGCHQAAGDSTHGYPNWALGWVKFYGPRSRVKAPTVAPSGQLVPRQRGDQQRLRPVAGG